MAEIEMDRSSVHLDGRKFELPEPVARFILHSRRERSQFQAELESERTARREAEAELATELAEERIITQRLIAAVEELQEARYLEACGNKGVEQPAFEALVDRVRSISEGEAE